MKNLKLTMLALLLLISIRANAQNNKLGVLTSPDVTKKSVVKAFGEPNNMNVRKGESIWTYKTDTHTINIRWNDETMKMRNVAYTARVAEKIDWDSKFMDKIEIDKTSLKEAIAVFGTPNHLDFTTKHQRANYIYNNAQLSLMFKDGVLVRLNMTRG